MSAALQSTYGDCLKSKSGNPVAKICVFAGHLVLIERLKPWMTRPLAPVRATDSLFMRQVQSGSDRAQAAGLSTRPLQDRLEPLLAWNRDRRDMALYCGLSAQQEARLLG